MDLVSQKAAYFGRLHSSLRPIVSQIESQSISHQDKAKEVNSSIGDLVDSLKFEIIHSSGTISEKQKAMLVLQYCTSVVSLEYRHKVWPYEYMALSRRVGELLERLCSVCWDFPSRENVARIEAPSFEQIKASIITRIEANLTGIVNAEDILRDINYLAELVGEINMKEDEVFQVEAIPHVVDFKSGFGSNEKGNTLRLLAVGRAYKLWNPNTQLFLLVRQEENNNYLNVIRRSGLWTVYCGVAAYREIQRLTGADMVELRGSVIDFQNDLSPAFFEDIGGQLSDLRSYLNW